MPVGRPKTREERDIKLAELWNKLVRTVYAIVDYDVYLHRKVYKKLSKSEKTKLKKACSKAIEEATK